MLHIRLEQPPLSAAHSWGIIKADVSARRRIRDVIQESIQGQPNLREDSPYRLSNMRCLRFRNHTDVLPTHTAQAAFTLAALPTAAPRKTPSIFQ